MMSGDTKIRMQEKYKLDNVGKLSFPLHLNRKMLSRESDIHCASDTFEPI